jgi:HK97 family phage prohead protease
MVKSELITKMSFAFTIDKNGDKWEETKDKAKRTILNINKLYDVSIVDIPYYDSTEVIARNLKEISDIKKINLELEKQKILILEEFYK